MTGRTDRSMADVVRHTEGLRADRDLSRGEAAARMAEHLEDVTVSDILAEL